MANFDSAIVILLQHEGGYTNTPGDAGGPTNFGICQRDNPNLDIINLTRDQAVDYYRANWWDKYGFGNINDDDLATYFFDHAVNVGISSITKVIQRIVGTIADGALGPNTIAMINQNYTSDMMKQVQDGLWSHYEAILAVHPEDAKFKNGWYSRCYSA